MKAAAAITTEHGSIYTLDTIRAKLATDAAWATKGLLAIYARQTADEQAAGTTVHDNGIGFSGCDSEILSSFAQQIGRGYRLSIKQMAIVHKRMPRYARQLLAVAQERQQERHS